MRMKSYGELTITLRDCSVQQFGDLAEKETAGGWTRDRSKDVEMNRTSSDGAWFTFVLRGHEILPSAYLFITQEKTANVLYVPNVISPARDQLTYDEYNQVLQSFATHILTPLKNRGILSFELRGFEIDLSAEIPVHVFDRLRRFSALANKRTGSSHPLDQERWMDFLIASDQAGVRLSSHTLRRWLVEIEGWDSDQASRLAEEYEFGRGLLERAS